MTIEAIDEIEEFLENPTPPGSNTRVFLFDGELAELLLDILTDSHNLSKEALEENDLSDDLRVFCKKEIEIIPEMIENLKSNYLRLDPERLEWLTATIEDTITSNDQIIKEPEHYIVSEEGVCNLVRQNATFSTFLGYLK